MKLVADKHGRICSVELFPPSTAFDASRQPDGSVRVVELVEKTLLTPVGLRTLAPGSPDYRPHYGPGDQACRDSAYHQGTAWPWLMGHFIDAHLKVYGDKARSRALLDTLAGPGLENCGIGTLNEIFDADPPHAPNGCIAQAWSVSEVLRALANTAP